MDKKVLIIGGVMIISLILNVVLYSNINSVEGKVESKFSEEIENKNTIISGLELKVDELNDLIENSTPESRKEISKTKLEEQNEYKTIATDFINSYLEYNTDNLKDRREKLLSITSEELVNRIAPEPINEEENQLSSDPTFTSVIDEITIYITEIDEITNTCQVIADVKYDTKSTEGEASVSSLVQLQLQKNEDNSIKVMTYEYYPIN